jgi:uncharacterized membrane protein
MNLKVRAVFFILRRHNNKCAVVFRGNHLWLLINLWRASRHHVQGVFSVLHQNAFAQNPSPFVGLLIGGNVMNFCVCSFVISEVSRIMETCRSKVHYIWLYLCQKFNACCSVHLGNKGNYLFQLNVHFLMFLESIYYSLNMFQTSQRPSSGALL